MSPEEKRDNFRIADTLPLDCITLDDEVDHDLDSLANLDLKSELNALKTNEGVDKELLELLSKFDTKLSALIMLLRQRGKSVLLPPLKDITISAGGVSFYSQSPYTPAAKLTINLGLPPEPYTMLSLDGEVVRSVEASSGGKTGYVVSVKFVNLVEDKRQALTRYIFDHQRQSISAV